MDIVIEEELRKEMEAQVMRAIDKNGLYSDTLDEWNVSYSQEDIDGGLLGYLVQEELSDMSDARFEDFYKTFAFINIKI